MLKERVDNLLDQINDRLVTVSSEHLKRTQNILLVAGTAKKAPAIRQLLTNDYPIRFLCTDQIAAEQLLRN